MSRQKTPYEDRPEHVQFMIDCLAAYMTPQQVVNALITKYGEDARIKRETVKVYAKRYAGDVLRRRRELSVELPIMNPIARFKYLQDIVEKAMGGVTRESKKGELYETLELANAVAAIREVNVMQGFGKGQQPLIDDPAIAEEKARQEQLAITREAYQALKEANPGKSDADLISYLIASMPEHKDVIEELSSELVQ